MKIKKNNRDKLEAKVLEELEDLLNLRFTAGSGNVFGDADLRPRYRRLDDIHIGIECKRNTRSNNHLVKWDEYQKARTQIEKGGKLPVFVTSNAANHVMVHLSLKDFKWLMEIVKEAYGLLQEQAYGKAP